MSAGFLSSIDAFVASLSEFELESCPPDACVTIVERLTRVEKICAATRARAAARVASSGAHREHGFANPAEWLAQQMGSIVGRG